MKKNITVLAIIEVFAAVLTSCSYGNIKRENSEESITGYSCYSAEQTSGDEASYEDSFAEYSDELSQTSSEEPSGTPSEDISYAESSCESGSEYPSGETSTEEQSVDISQPAEPFSEEDESSSIEESSSAEESSQIDESEIFEQNGILIVGNRRMEQFVGGISIGKSFCGYIAELKEKLGESVGVYFMPCPQASVYYAPAEGKYAYLRSSGKITFDKLKKFSLDYGTYNYVNAYAALETHVDEPIYFRTEHHWTALGAYYATKVFTEEAGVEYPELAEYEKRVKNGFVGSLYTFSKKAKILADNPEDIEYYVNKDAVYTAYVLNSGNTDFNKYNYTRRSILFEKLNNYGVFLCLDDMSYKIVTNAGSGRTLVVIKDSYGNAVIPFLLSSFDTIYVVDFRSFKRNCVSLVQETGATDVLVIASGFSVCGTVGKKLEKMINLQETEEQSAPSA